VPLTLAAVFVSVPLSETSTQENDMAPSLPGRLANPRPEARDPKASRGGPALRRFVNKRVNFSVLELGAGVRRGCVRVGLWEQAWFLPLFFF
jgi:hypothetical protein